MVAFSGLFETLNAWEKYFKSFSLDNYELSINRKNLTGHHCPRY